MALGTDLQRHTQAIEAAIGMGLSEPQRRYYAHLLICRLLLIHVLQRGGWLPGADPWYLQTLLGYSQEQGRDRFFSQVILPLCCQGFGLPPPERPPALGPQLGTLPYLGSSLFEPQPWELRPDLQMADEPWEALLAWLAEQPDVIPLDTLAIAFEQWLASAPMTSESPDPGLTATVEAVIGDAMLSALAQETGQTFPDLESLIADLGDDLCQRLVETILPRTTVLDPACGSGRLLRAALPPLYRLYDACWRYARHSSSLALGRWAEALHPQGPNPAWRLTAHILTRHLYGVDLRPEAVAATRCQLYWALLATTTPAQGLAPLPSLAFTVLEGNALVGLIRVDAASFDQTLVPTSTAKTTAETPTAMPVETVVQGSLLQPLAAENYRSIRQEKHIRIEHYQAQNQVLEEGNPLPQYAQATFLRDGKRPVEDHRISDLNQVAQAKLNQLLLDEFSQTLGIRLREPRPDGRHRKRLLTLADIDALNPCHWGFHFSDAIETEGGFAVILTQPPQGTLRPRMEPFYRDHCDRFQALGIDLKTFRKQRQSLLQRYPDLAAAWSQYASHIFLLGDYCRRSRHYSPPQRGTLPRALYQSALFARRCESLLRPGGVLLILPPKTVPRCC